MDISHEPVILDSFNAPDQKYLQLNHSRPEESLRLVQYGWMRTSPRYGYGPMIRDHYLIHFISNGMGRVVLPEQSYQLKAGMCFLLYPHLITYYEADADDPWEYYWMGFEGSRAERLLCEIGFKPNSIAMTIPNADKVFSCLDDMRLTPSATEYIDRLTGFMLLTLDAMRHGGCAESARPNAHDQGLMNNEYVRIVISILETSYLERISVDEIAGKLGLNRSYLSVLFKKYTGKSIKQYLTELRVEQAAIRLMNPYTTIRNVAFKTGFNDPLYFSRVFTRIKGMSPSNYRQWLASQPANETQD